MSDHMTYVGRTKCCGRVVAAMVDSDLTQKDQPRELAKWLRSGLTIERLTKEQVKTAEWECTCAGERQRRLKAEQESLF